MSDYITKNYWNLVALSKQLLVCAELGYKEIKTKQIILEFLSNYEVSIEQEFALTGFSVSFGQGSPHIGLIAELDGISTPNHPFVHGVDNAAHSCGHSSQVVMMIGAFLALRDSLGLGQVTLFFCPAEEFVDLEYRQQLKQQGLISAYGGKQEMLLKGVFAGVDCFISGHGMADSEYRYSLASSLAGFTYLAFKFKGQSAHAAVLPHLGKNALNMFTLYQTAVGLLRETFVDEDKNRVHGRIIKAGDSVNTIADEVVYESYVRSFKASTLAALTEQLQHTAVCCAQALNGSCEVTKKNGYLPLNQNYRLSKLLEKQMLKYCSFSDILWYEKSVAAGDIGDLATFYPCVQFGYSGFSGRMHGDNLMIADNELLYNECVRIIVDTVEELLDPLIVQQIKGEFRVSITEEEYLKRFA